MRAAAADSALELFATLESSAAGHAIRTSLWLYPLANVVHILGVALVFGAVAAVDLRLLGVAAFAPLEPLLRLLLPCAWVGFGLAAASGPVLFAADAVDLARHPLLWAKLLAIACAGGNALYVHRLRRTGRLDPARWPTRLAGALSLGVWISVIGLGRLIAYF